MKNLKLISTMAIPTNAAQARAAGLMIPRKAHRKTGNPAHRPKGSRNRHTLRLIQQLAETRQAVVAYLEERKKGLSPKKRADPRYGIFNCDAHALLQCVYMDEEQPMELRVDAAKAAIGYEKPKLQSVEMANRKGQVFAIRFEEGDDKI